MLARIGSLPASSGMNTLRACSVSAMALPCRGRPPVGDPVLLPLARVFSPHVDRSDGGKAGEGNQSESRIGSTIRTPHNVTPDATGPGGAVLEDVADNCSVRSTARCELRRGMGSCGARALRTAAHSLGRGMTNRG